MLRAIRTSGGLATILGLGIAFAALSLGMPGQAHAQRDDQGGGWGEPADRSDGTVYDADDTSDRGRNGYDGRDGDRDGRRDVGAAGDRVAYGDHVGWGARVGIGFVADPSMFLVDLSAPYDFGSGVSVGPRFQIGADKDRTYLAPTVNLEYSHDLSRMIRGPLGRIRPLVGAGIGFAWLEKEDRAGQNDEAEFLFDLSTGAEYPLTDGFALASVIDFNIMPTEVLGEDFIFTWQLIQLRAQF